MKMFRTVVSLGLCVILATLSVAGQQHVVDETTLDRLIEARLADEEAQRAEVSRVLDRPGVAKVAAQLGLSASELTTAVSTLEGEELAEIAARAQQVETALAGGQSTITISTTTIIIILLVALLIAVVA